MTSTELYIEQANKVIVMQFDLILGMHEWVLALMSGRSQEAKRVQEQVVAPKFTELAIAVAVLCDRKKRMEDK